MLYHYHCHRPWRFAPVPTVSRGSCFRPSVSAKTAGSPEEIRQPVRRDLAFSGCKQARGNQRRNRAIRRDRGARAARQPVHLSRATATLHLAAPPDLCTGSKDDGTDGTFAAPSDSKPRTGRPARLNTWEIAATDTTRLLCFLLCRPFSARRVTNFHDPPVRKFRFS